jgi:hypothetical protein
MRDFVYFFLINFVIRLIQGETFTHWLLAAYCPLPLKHMKQFPPWVIPDRCGT